MSKKAKAKSAPGRADAAGAATAAAQSVVDSSHQIWLAGLGAFARAPQEGTKMFEALVRQGARFQERTRKAATQTAAAARDAAAAKAKEVQQMAGGTWDKLEQVFEDRVARALSKLGVYTQNDVQRLAARVDELALAVNKLVNAQGGGKAAPTRGRAAKRTSGAKAAPTAKRSGRAPKARG